MYFIARFELFSIKDMEELEDFRKMFDILSNKISSSLDFFRINSKILLGEKYSIENSHFKKSRKKEEYLK